MRRIRYNKEGEFMFILDDNFEIRKMSDPKTKTIIYNIKLLKSNISQFSDGTTIVIEYTDNETIPIAIKINDSTINIEPSELEGFSKFSGAENNPSFTFALIHDELPIFAIVDHENKVIHGNMIISSESNLDNSATYSIQKIRDYEIYDTECIVFTFDENNVKSTKTIKSSNKETTWNYEFSKPKSNDSIDVMLRVRGNN